MVSVQSDRVAGLESPTREDLMQLTYADLKVATEEEDESAAPGDVNAGLEQVPTPNLTLEGDQS
jgi:hypothetical protein